MSPSACNHSSPRCQCGAASIAIALLLVFILAAAVTAVMKMSGSSVIDAAKNEEQVAALFLAESGVERALGRIVPASDAGTLSNTNCTNLTGTYSVGNRGGQFSYLSATSTPATCGGGSPAPCESCAFTVKGALPSGSSRTVRVIIGTSPTEGAAGCGNTVQMYMPVTNANSYAFTHLAYRAKDDGTGCSGGVDPSNARVGSCTNTDPSGDCNVSASGDFWDLGTTGTHAVSSMGVSAHAPSTGSYSITTTLEVAGTGQPRGSGTPVPRNYVQTGILFSPLSLSENTAFKGSYASNSTMAATGLTGSVNSDWTCQPYSATTSGKMSRAAGADTLVFGFSSWPTNPSAILSNISLGIQPMHRLTNRQGTTADNIYSQIWFSYNRAYDSTAHSIGSTPIASSGASFNGSLGFYDVRGHTIAGGATGAGGYVCPTGETYCLELQGGIVVSELMSYGDQVWDRTFGTNYGTLGKAPSALLLIGGTPGANNSLYYYSGSAIPNNTRLSTKSIVLKLVAVPTSGLMTTGDTITNPAATTPYGTLPNTPLTGTWGTAGSTYTLSSASPAYLAAASGSGTNLISTGTTVTVTNSPSQPPAPGTAVAVWSGNGYFPAATFSGTISGGNLTTTTSQTLCYGDALFGAGYKESLPSIVDWGIKPNTTIATPGCTSGTYFLVTGTTNAPSATMVARTAVVPKTFTGYISDGTTLNVTAVSYGSVAVGDALTGPNIAANTFITAKLTGNGGVGTYRVSPSQAGALSDSIIVATNPNSFAVSRSAPAYHLNNANVCGGVCAMFYDTAGTINTSFTLNGITSGDDWSSGFACLSGIDPFNIVTLGKKIAKRTSWAEVIE